MWHEHMCRWRELWSGGVDKRERRWNSLAVLWGWGVVFVTMYDSEPEGPNRRGRPLGKWKDRVWYLGVKGIGKRLLEQVKIGRGGDFCHGHPLRECFQREWGVKPIYSYPFLCSRVTLQDPLQMSAPPLFKGEYWGEFLGVCKPTHFGPIISTSKITWTEFPPFREEVAEWGRWWAWVWTPPVPSWNFVSFAELLKIIYMSPWYSNCSCTSTKMSSGGWHGPLQVPL